MEKTVAKKFSFGSIAVYAVVIGLLGYFVLPKIMHPEPDPIKDAQQNPENAMKLYLQTAYAFMHNQPGGSFDDVAATVTKADWEWFNANYESLFHDAFNLKSGIDPNEARAMAKRQGLTNLFNAGASHPNNEIIDRQIGPAEAVFTLRSRDREAMTQTDFKAKVVLEGKSWKVAGFAAARGVVERTGKPGDVVVSKLETPAPAPKAQAAAVPKKPAPNAPVKPAPAAAAKAGAPPPTEKETAGGAGASPDAGQAASPGNINAMLDAPPASPASSTNPTSPAKPGIRPRILNTKITPEMMAKLKEAALAEAAKTGPPKPGKAASATAAAANASAGKEETSATVPPSGGAQVKPGDLQAMLGADPPAKPKPGQAAGKPGAQAGKPASPPKPAAPGAPKPGAPAKPGAPPSPGAAMDEPSVVNQSELAPADLLLKQASADWDEGKYQLAVVNAGKALSIYKRILGENHPKIARVQKMIDAAKEAQNK